MRRERQDKQDKAERERASSSSYWDASPHSLYITQTPGACTVALAALAACSTARMRHRRSSMEKSIVCVNELAELEGGSAPIEQCDDLSRTHCLTFFFRFCVCGG